MSYPTPDEILAASTSLYKGDPAYAATIPAPFPPGSPAERKVKTLLRTVAKFELSHHGPCVDTVDHLCRALSAILRGKTVNSAALDVMADRTNPLHPLTRTYFAMRKIDIAIELLADMEAVDDPWLEVPGLYLNPEHSSEFKWVRRGFAIDPIMIRQGLADLEELDAGGTRADPCIVLAARCARLVRVALHPLRMPLDAAGNDKLLYYFGENPGEFRCGFRPRTVQSQQRLETIPSNNDGAPSPKAVMFEGQVEAEPPTGACEADPAVSGISAEDAASAFSTVTADNRKDLDG